jgi:hypothetical protein
MCRHIFKVDNPSFMGIQPPKGEPLLAAVVVFGGWLNPQSLRAVVFYGSR